MQGMGAYISGWIAALHGLHGASEAYYSAETEYETVQASMVGIQSNH